MEAIIIEALKVIQSFHKRQESNIIQTENELETYRAVCSLIKSFSRTLSKNIDTQEGNE